MKLIYRKKRSIISILLAGLLCLSAASCSKKSNTQGTQTAQSESTAINANDPNNGASDLQNSVLSSDILVEYTKTDLNEAYDTVTAEAVCGGNTARISGSGISLENNILTVSQAGCYLLSGSFEGQILIAAAETDKVQLVLDGLTVTYGEASPILCESADKLVITLAKDSVNQVNDTGSGYIEEDEDSGESVNTRTGGAIHSKCALTLNGSGSLTVNAGYHNGIFSKKTLKVISGTITVTAVSDGLKGKNAVAIKEGILNIEAGEDGIQCSEETDTAKGYIWIEGGVLNITAKNDGIDASLYLIIKGGDVNVTTTGTERKTADEITGTTGGFGGKGLGGFGGGFGGGFTSGASDGYAVNSEGYYKISSKGLKAGGALEISGGAVTVTSTGHAIQSAGSLTVNGSDTVVYVTARCDTYKANSKGLTADGDVTIADGTVTVAYSYEGVEAGGELTISGGRIRIEQAVDDGLNAGTNGQTIRISGGYLFVNAEGDGLDSNGNIVISGGTVIVAGPTSGGDGALDCGDGNYSIQVTGGLLIAYGSSGMAEAPSAQSTQCSISYNTTLNAGSVFYITDKNGDAVVAVRLLKSAQNIVISDPGLVQGETYTLFTGGNVNTETDDGLCTGDVSGGTSLGTLTLSSTITSNGGGDGFGPGGNGVKPGGIDGGFGGGIDGGIDGGFGGGKGPGGRM